MSRKWKISLTGLQHVMPEFGVCLKSCMHKHVMVSGAKNTGFQSVISCQGRRARKVTNSNQTTATSNLVNKCTLYSSIRLKHRHLCLQRQELFPGHIFHKNNHECASVRTSKQSKAIERSPVLACQLLLTLPETKGGELHERGVRKGERRQ